MPRQLLLEKKVSNEASEISTVVCPFTTRLASITVKMSFPGNQRNTSIWIKSWVGLLKFIIMVFHWMVRIRHFVAQEPRHQVSQMQSSHAGCLQWTSLLNNLLIRNLLLARHWKVRADCSRQHCVSYCFSIDTVQQYMRFTWARFVRSLSRKFALVLPLLLTFLLFCLASENSSTVAMQESSWV